MSDQHEIPMGYFYSQPMDPPLRAKKKVVDENSGRSAVQRILEMQPISKANKPALKSQLSAFIQKNPPVKDGEKAQEPVGIDGVYVLGVAPYLPWISILPIKLNDRSGAKGRGDDLSLEVSAQDLAVKILKLIPKDLSHIRGREAVEVVNWIIGATNTALVFVINGVASLVIAHSIPLELDRKQIQRLSRQEVATDTIRFAYELGGPSKEVKSSSVFSLS